MLRWPTSRAQVSAELLGAGPLEPLLALPGVTDVLGQRRRRGVDRPRRPAAHLGALSPTTMRFAGWPSGWPPRPGVASTMPARSSTPRLPDGTRLHAILPPLVAHPTLSLRVLARRRFEPGRPRRRRRDRCRRAPGCCEAIVAARLGVRHQPAAPAPGKTTLLGALLSLLPADERIVVIEDAAELVLAHPHVVRLLGRTANVEGAGAIGPAELVRQALRMRPDRLVVGEFRGAEFAELLAALNTGHEGGAATVHANSVADVPARFAALGSLAGLDSAAVRVQVASAFQVVIQLRREAGSAGAGWPRSPSWSASTAAAARSFRSGPPTGSGAGADRLARQFRRRGGRSVPELLR